MICQKFLDQLARTRAIVDRVAKELSDPGFYAARRVLNAEELQAWWDGVRQEGEPERLDANLHVTVAYSRVTPESIAPDPNPLAGDTWATSIGTLGPDGAVVLFLASPALDERWRSYREAGATWDHEQYQPHVTLFSLPSGYDSEQFRDGNTADIPLPTFPLRFGPEVTGTLDQDVFQEDDSVSKDQEGTFRLDVPIEKVNDEERMVYGWASVATVDGQPLTDLQDDVIDISDLKKAAHTFMRESRDGGEMHVAKGKGVIVESIVFDKAQQDVLGIDLGREGWYIGYKVLDDAVWKAVKSGVYKMFSIGGRGRRVPVGKFNHSHGSDGKFSGGGGGGRDSHKAILEFRQHHAGNLAHMATVVAHHASDAYQAVQDHGDTAIHTKTLHSAAVHTHLVAAGAHRAARQAAIDNGDHIAAASHSATEERHLDRAHQLDPSRPRGHI